MYDGSGSVNYRDEYRVLNAENSKLRADNLRLIAALHDAINRPMGVVPESAEEFYDHRRVGR